MATADADAASAARRRRYRPQSAGAHPGPVCYRKSGHLAVTDANVFLGRVIPRYFPKIFGPGEVSLARARVSHRLFVGLLVLLFCYVTIAVDVDIVSGNVVGALPLLL